MSFFLKCQKKKEKKKPTSITHPVTVLFNLLPKQHDVISWDDLMAGIMWFVSAGHRIWNWTQRFLNSFSSAAHSASLMHPFIFQPCDKLFTYQLLFFFYISSVQNAFSSAHTREHDMILYITVFARYIFSSVMVCGDYIMIRFQFRCSYENREALTDVWCQAGSKSNRKEKTTDMWFSLKDCEWHPQRWWFYFPVSCLYYWHLQ